MKILPIFLLVISLGLLIIDPSLAHGQQCWIAEPTTVVTSVVRLDESASTINIAAIPAVPTTSSNAAGPTFLDLDNAASFSVVRRVTDSLGVPHQLYYYMFHTGASEFQFRLYVTLGEINSAWGPPELPRIVQEADSNTDFTLTFDGSGNRTIASTGNDFTGIIPWGNGSAPSTITFDFSTTTSTMVLGADDVSYSQDGESHLDKPHTPNSIGVQNAGDVTLGINGNLSSSSSGIAIASVNALGVPTVGAGAIPTVEWSDLSALAAFSLDSVIESPTHASVPIRHFYFHTGANQYSSRSYISAQYVSSGQPDKPLMLTESDQLTSTSTLAFNSSGARSNVPMSGIDRAFVIPWLSGGTTTINVAHQFSQRGTSSVVCSQLLDWCPADPSKTVPGQCGCGVSDADTDDNSVPDCFDICPEAPDPLPDTDNDNVPDDYDLCQADPQKRAPGACGCGVPDVDSDSDSIPDCMDSCPNDSKKLTPGSCGCGLDDSDLNFNGAADCVDPSESTTLSPPILSQDRSTIEMQRFLGRVKYRVEFSQGKKRIIKYVDAGHISLPKLDVGIWNIRYKVTVDGAASSFASSFSDSLRLQITRSLKNRSKRLQ